MSKEERRRMSEGLEIVKALKACGFMRKSQKEAALELGVSHTTVDQIERIALSKVRTRLIQERALLLAH